MNSLELSKNEMTKLVHWINNKGWSPATSTNYSFVNPENQSTIIISRSGVDKSLFQNKDWLQMNRSGRLLPEFEHEKSSAETAIHVMLYELFSPQVVLHTHSVLDTILSRKFAANGNLKLEGYEVLKGLPGIKTHESSVSIPIVPNAQDMDSFVKEIQPVLIEPDQVFGFLIESHGLYTWGTNISEAKRHLEVFQFLFECEFQLSLM